MVVSRFDIWLIGLDPTFGSEINKSRPCLVVSPDTSNQLLDNVIIAPMTTGMHPYETRITCAFGGKTGHIILDQLRTVDKQRLITKLGVLEETTAEVVLDRLAEMFAR